MKRLIKLTLLYLKNVFMGADLNSFVKSTILSNLQNIFCNEIYHYDKEFNKLPIGHKAYTYHLLYKDGSTVLFSIMDINGSIEFKLESTNMVSLPIMNIIQSDLLTIQNRVNQNKVTILEYCD